LDILLNCSEEVIYVLGLMVFNATFNNIPVTFCISNSNFVFIVIKQYSLWQLYNKHVTERTYIIAVSFISGGKGVPRENHRPVASHRQTVIFTFLADY